MKTGDLLSHYKILALLGAGGMGEVYKAEDTRLKRAVAIKVLTPALSEHAEAKQRLITEAQAASALDHPNICTIYEVDETPDGRVFLVMAYYDGETLSKRIAAGAIPIADAIPILIQLTRAAAAAHEAGVIHRDIKPANILLTSKSPDDLARVKLLDFGIAKLADQTSLTRTGTTIGTMAYMAPEHIAGHAIDARADIWSIGVVLHEVITGRRPFDGDNPFAIMKAIADTEAPSLQSIRPDAPVALDAIAKRALKKRPEQRYASARELLADLEALRPSGQSVVQTVPIAAPLPPVRRTRRWLTAAAVIVIAIGAASWFFAQRVRASEISQTVADLRSLVEGEHYAAAFRKLHTLRPEIASDPSVAAASRDLFIPIHVSSDPPGADVFVKDYTETDGEWIPLGRTPLDTRGLYQSYRWRVVKDGYETFEGSGPALGNPVFRLPAKGSVPDGMVLVPGGALPDNGGRFGDFYIDKYEVTNKAYKAFVVGGGYRDPKYWPESFDKDGQTLSWAQAMAEFRDTTGRPGPSTWELGTYPDGQDDFPVTGISWYEANAYAKFAGKTVPTVYHWRAAAAQSIYSLILEVSNFTGKAPVRVGSLQSLGPFGTYDMAGNAKEWCENAVEGKRYILGGGWNEPNYQYRAADARPPLDRKSNFGVRLIKAVDPAAVPAAAHVALPRLSRDYSREKPASDELFTAFVRSYEYDHSDLAAKTESVNETDAWRVERVSYNAAYGGQRIPAYLFLPKNAKPPYETVVYFPHSGGLVLDSFQQAEMAYLGFLVKSGRALLFPMYNGMYERRLKRPLSGPNEFRDQIIQQVQDVRRSLDYLEQRTDIAKDKLAYFGVSLGAARAPIVLAVEHRFKAAVMWSGGLPSGPSLPEVDPINFAGRVRTPILMLNGRDDFTFPVEASQEPLYRMFGTAAADKGRKVYDGGHVFPFSRMMGDSLDWLDRYLGVPK
jgi:dienelactone hydrolase/tRNA A-37 threonylcarbamoyl transferase component Bud32